MKLSNFTLHSFCLIFFLMFSVCAVAQTDERLETIREQLVELSAENEGLNQTFETEINITNVNLQTLLMGVAELHDININVDPSVGNKTVSNAFSGVNIIDLFVFLCKEYSLTIDFTGNILSFKPYSVEQVMIQDPFYVEFFENNIISMDIKNQKLSEVTKKISQKSGRNIVFRPGLENKPINIFTNKAKFENALQQLAIANALNLEYSEDDFIVFTKPENDESFSISQSNRKKVGYEIIDEYTQMLSVNFKNTPVKDIINSLTADLNLNVFTATPLDEAGQVTFVANEITFDELISKIFENTANNQNTPASNTPNQGNFNNNPNQQAQISNSSANFSFKKENGIYYFGTEAQLSIKKVELIRLKHRSVEMLSDPAGGMTSRRTGAQNVNNSAQAAIGGFNQGINNSQFNNRNTNQNNRNGSNFNSQNNFIDLGI